VHRSVSAPDLGRGPEAESFRAWFADLTGNCPFPWQETLFHEFVEGNFRPTCDLPTGLGKTSIIAIWLLALARRAQVGAVSGFPRRLVYIVNRRTVVDQATREAEKLRRALDEQFMLRAARAALSSLCVRADSAPLVISTLRGEFADNAEWRDDPARAAIIVGTVDMIGSRLLFSGYGPGFKSRPLHAGFLGQDALLVHDEAHLEPAFQELVQNIVREQRSEYARLHVMALTATARDGATVEAPLLSEADRENPVVAWRLNARKSISFHPTDEKGIAGKIAECALIYRNSNHAIVVFLQRLEDVRNVAAALDKKGCNVQRLTGTMRGRERDRLATSDPIFARFGRNSAATPQEGTVYLICASAGEVGIDMSADHLVCDLTPFDSMAQRFGRVNRFGEGDTGIDIVYAEAPDITGAKSQEERDGRALRRGAQANARTAAESEGT
jgi:CRISPR-associated endonuclease/helicase Cas3